MDFAYEGSNTLVVTHLCNFAATEPDSVEH